MMVTRRKCKGRCGKIITHGNYCNDCFEKKPVTKALKAARELTEDKAYTDNMKKHVKDKNENGNK